METETPSASFTNAYRNGTNDLERNGTPPVNLMSISGEATSNPRLIWNTLFWGTIRIGNHLSLLRVGMGAKEQGERRKKV